VLTKLDAVSSPERVEQYRKAFQARGYEVIAISSVVRSGIDELVEALATRVFTLAPSGPADVV
jgi:putative ribosome biogenesis GTPase RsgA